MENKLMPKYKNYRVCYKNGIPTKGQEIYELHKYCRCSECVRRLEYRRGCCNTAVVTTKDITKIDEVAEFLKTWTCGEEKEVEIVYYQF